MTSCPLGSALEDRRVAGPQLALVLWRLQGWPTIEDEQQFLVALLGVIELGPLPGRRAVQGRAEELAAEAPADSGARPRAAEV